MKDISTDINSRLPFDGAYALAEITDLSRDILEELNESEKQELTAITSQHRQREYLTSRHTLKILGASLGIKKLIIQKDDLGQPYGRGDDDHFYISIAHTDQTVFCGISVAHPIGLDLEPISRKVPDRLQSRILHPREDSAIRALAPIRLWTIKEAYIKLRGQGLRLNMNDVRILERDGQYEAEINNDKRAKICSFHTGNNWLAVAHYL
ncbi:MAG: 4'-phosphopantetheinyl transferase superfamily protein [Fodinibius sp.]|nr:4'-phosphopantetheinyl transferase superfamily protein [Fodinibius sp.]